MPALLDFPRRNLIAIAVLIIIWFVTLSSLGPQRYANTAVHDPSKENWTFIAAGTTIDTGYAKDFDPNAIRELCDAQKLWLDDVVFQGRDNQGGIGNIRQEILSTIRYAIDAGAGFVVPTINVRGDDLTTLNSGKEIGMDYVFDKDEFVRRLKLACPQMPLYENLDELRKKATVNMIAAAPRDMSQENGVVLSVKPEIARQRAPLGHITLVAFLITIQYYPICEDTEAFANTFGHLLPFRKDVVHLSASILHTLTTRYHLPIDPGEAPAPPKSYLAVHLRTDADAIAAGWPSYEEQVARYLELAASGNYPVIYVASGNQSSVQLFRAATGQLPSPVPVVMKEDLLSPFELRQLKALTWDQQALVDYNMMLKAGYFAGLDASSFSGNIAVARRVVNGRGSCGGKEEGWADKWIEGMPMENQKGWPPHTAYKDKLSELIGMGPSGWEEKMWP